MKQRHIGVALSALATLFFVVDAVGKLLQLDPVLQGAQALGWPAGTMVPLGIVLLVGAALYALPRTSVLGAIYLTGFLGGAVAAHYRIGSPLATHVLFGVYVGLVMWAGLLLRRPTLLDAVAARAGNSPSRAP